MGAKFYDVNGQLQEVNLPPTLYKMAHDAGMTIDAYLGREYATDEAKYGSTFQQMMAGAGMFKEDNPKLGIKAAKVGDVIDGRCDPNYNPSAGANTADAIPTSRILMPAAIITQTESHLFGNAAADIALFDTFIGHKESIAGSRFLYPEIDYTRSEQPRSKRTSQLAEPNTMLTLTVSDKTGSVPSFSLGLVVSNEAMAQMTIDFVSLSIARQAEAEAADQLDFNILSMLNGNIDNGKDALPVTKVSVFDPSINADGVITQLAWMSWLRNNHRKRTIDVAMMDLPTYLKVESRQGKPVITGDDPLSKRADIVPNLTNLQIGPVKVFLTEPGVLPTGTIVGFDSRYAMRKVTNSEAEYKAAEQLVMQKAMQMRWDWGFDIHRLYDDAWDVLSLTH